MMNKLQNIPRWQFYSLVGAAWVLLWIFSASFNSGTFIPQSLNEVWRAIYLVVVNLIFFEYSLPCILRKRSTILFNILIGILLIGIQLILVSVGLYGWKYLGVQLHIYTVLRHSILVPDSAYYRFIDEVSYQAQGGMTSLFFFGLCKLFYDHFKLTQTTQQLRLEKQEAELNYLKSQTNPHFLFNTLNNIYSLSRDKSDLAPESILRLSKILRFMLYETSMGFISVQQEIEIISDYIALEKMRYDDSLRITFYQDIEDMKQPLPPLLLIPLVENAFKHGISETRDQPFVDIHFTITRQQLTFVVKNSTGGDPDEKTPGNGPADVKENIGLSNLRRQLELLYTDYALHVQQHDAVFTATLKIHLGSHV